MKIFVCGGDFKNNLFAIKKLNEVINHNLPILYVPLAKDEAKYPYINCLDIVKKDLQNVDVTNIEMVKTFEDFASKNYHKYSAIYIDNGNPFKLLNGIEKTDALTKFKEYIDNNGIVISCGTSAIILGQCTNTYKLADKSTVDFNAPMGLDLVNYYSFFCPFNYQDIKAIVSTQKYLLELSKYEKIIALSKDVTLYINDGVFNILSNKPFHIFEKGSMITYNNKGNRIEEFNKIENSDELMNFMNKNITYGWQEYTGELHFNNLINFRQKYKVNSIKKSLLNGLGTCIEQAKIIKAFFDKIGFENKLFCYRCYENDSNLDKDIRMHCFVLFKYNDFWYHFEHSNSLKRGIHEYKSVEEAVSNIISEYKKEDIRVLTEIPNIPDDISFQELNAYVNSFEKYYK